MGRTFYSVPWQISKAAAVSGASWKGCEEIAQECGLELWQAKAAFLEEQHRIQRLRAGRFHRLDRPLVSLRERLHRKIAHLVPASFRLAFPVREPFLVVGRVGFPGMAPLDPAGVDVRVPQGWLAKVWRPGHVYVKASDFNAFILDYGDPFLCKGVVLFRVKLIVRSKSDEPKPVFVEDECPGVIFPPNTLMSRPALGIYPSVPLEEIPDRVMGFLASCMKSGDAKMWRILREAEYVKSQKDRERRSQA